MPNEVRMPDELREYLEERGLIDSTISVGTEEDVYVVQMVDDIWLVTSIEDIENSLTFHMSSISDKKIDDLLLGYTGKNDEPVTVSYMKDNYEEGWKNIAVELMYDALQIKQNAPLI